MSLPHGQPDPAPLSRPDPQPAPARVPHPPRRFRVWRFLIPLLFVCLAGWTGAALILPPTLVRSALQTWLSEALNAPVTVENITLHPLTLRATLNGVRLPAHNGESLLSIREIELVPGVRLYRPPGAGDSKIAPDWRFPRPQVVISLRVTEPELDIAYLGDGVFSFSDLIRSETETPEAEAASRPHGPAHADVAPPLFLLSDLKIMDGTLILRDKPLGSFHVLSDISFDVPFLVPTPRERIGQGGQGGEEAPEDEEAEDLPVLAAPTLSARLDGTPIQAGGSIRPVGDTLRTTFEIRAGRLELTRFADYLSRFTPLKLTSGVAEPALTFVISQPRRGNVEVMLSGRVRLEDMAIAAPSGETAARLKRADIALGGFTLSERRVALESVELDGLELTIRRDRKGRIDWQEWFADLADSPAQSPDTIPDAGRNDGPGSSAGSGKGSGKDGAPSPEPLSRPAPAFVVEGADLVLRDASFVWEDAAFSGSGRIGITGVDGRIAEYSTRPGARTAMRLSFGIDNEGVLALEGEGTINPPTLRASLLARDFSLAVLRPALGGTSLSDMNGRLDFQGNVEMKDSGAGMAPAWRAEAGEAALRAFSFGRSAGKNPALSVDACRFRGLSLNTAARTFSLDALKLAAPHARLLLGTDGPRLALPASGGSGKTTTGAVPDLAAEARRWRVRVGSLAAEKGRLFRVSAAGAAKATPLVSDFSLSAAPLTLDPAQTIAFTLHTRGTRDDTLDVSGNVRPAPLKLDARIRATGLALDTLDGFVRPWTDATLAGRADGDIRLALEARADVGNKPSRTDESGRNGRGPDVRVDGDLTLRDVVVNDGATNRRLLRFRRFSATGLRYATSGAGTPGSGKPVLEAAELVLDRPNLPLIVDRNGRLALLAALRKKPAASAAPKTPHAREGRTEADWFSGLNVAKAVVRDGRLLLSDQRFAPPVTVAVQGLEVAASGLSAQAGTSARLSLGAQLDGSPVRLTGAFNVLVSPPTADLTLTADNVDLSRYSAYARKYMGCPIEQGRLNLKSVIRTSRRDFSADSEIVLRQLVLGPRDPASGAPNYSAGLALLSDFNGDIRLNVPLKGSLDNISLQTGGIVGKALAGLFTKVLTSPVSLLGGLFSLFGEDDPQLRFISFAPGAATLSRASRARVDATAEVLRLHPKEKARLVGLYEPESDAAGLRRMGLLRRLRELKLAGLPAGERAAGPSASRQGTPGPETNASAAKERDDLRIDPREYEELLFRAFKAARAKSGASGPIRRERPDVMERELEALTPVGREQLEELARARAAAVRARLLEIDPTLSARVGLAADRNGRPLVRAGAARVELELR